MTERNPVVVALLSIITFGIYTLVWLVMTKREMCARGADIPTAWLVIVPLVNIWWLWKYSEGVEKITKSSMQAALSFILLFLVEFIGIAIVQYEFNKLKT